MAVTPESLPAATTATVRPVHGFHIPSLDGLRAASIALVFIAHGGLPGLPLPPVPGGFGVTVFFFLSGFLITTLMRMEQEKNGRVSLKKFYLRRSLRILPPFYLVLAAAWVANLAFGLSDTIEPAAVLAQSLHYTNYWIIEHNFDGLPFGTGVYWSLAVEEHFYLLFPLIFILIARTGASAGKMASCLLAACGAILAWRLYLASNLDLSAPLDVARLELASDTRFDSLLFGCALAIYGNPSLDRSRFSEQTWKYVLFPLGIAGLLASFLIRDEFVRGTWRYTLQGVSLIPIFVCAVRYPDWLVNRPLNLRPVAFLGTLSYSIYLIHQTVIGVMGKTLSGSTANGAAGLFNIAICIGIAWLIYEAVEKPCARLRRRLHA